MDDLLNIFLRIKIYNVAMNYNLRKSAMKTRNDIKANYVISLIDDITKIISTYQQKHYHWWRQEDPEDLHPHQFLQSLEKVRLQVKESQARIQEFCTEVLNLFEQLKNIIPLNYDLISIQDKLQIAKEKLKDQFEKINSEELVDIEIIYQLLEILKVDMQDCTDSSVGLNCFADIMLLIGYIDSERNRFFDQYISIVDLLTKHINHEALRNVLLNELKSLREANESLVSNKEYIEQACKNIKKAALFTSRRHQLFCQAWGVSGDMHDYRVWLALIETNLIKEELDNDCYMKIPILFAGKFTVIQNHSINNEIKNRWEREIEIWSHTNLIKFFTQYLFDYALTNPNADIEKKGNDIVYLLVEIISKVQQIRSSLGMELYNSNEITTALKIFFNSSLAPEEKLGNVQQLMRHQTSLKELAYVFSPIDGRIIFLDQKMTPTLASAKVLDLPPKKQSKPSSPMPMPIVLGAGILLIGGLILVSLVAPMIWLGAPLLLAKIGIAGLCAAATLIAGSCGLGVLIGYQDKKNQCPVEAKTLPDESQTITPTSATCSSTLATLYKEHGMEPRENPSVPIETLASKAANGSENTLVPIKTLSSNAAIGSFPKAAIKEEEEKHERANSITLN